MLGIKWWANVHRYLSPWSLHSKEGHDNYQNITHINWWELPLWRNFSPLSPLLDKASPMAPVLGPLSPVLAKNPAKPVSQESSYFDTPLLLSLISNQVPLSNFPITLLRAHWLQIPTCCYCVQGWVQSHSPISVILTPIAIILNEVPPAACNKHLV